MAWLRFTRPHTMPKIKTIPQTLRISTTKDRLAGDITICSYKSETDARAAELLNISARCVNMVRQSSSNLLLLSFIITWRHFSSARNTNLLPNQ